MILWSKNEKKYSKIYHNKKYKRKMKLRAYSVRKNNIMLRKYMLP